MSQTEKLPRVNLYMNRAAEIRLLRALQTFRRDAFTWVPALASPGFKRYPACQCWKRGIEQHAVLCHTVLPEHKMAVRHPCGSLRSLNMRPHDGVFIKSRVCLVQAHRPFSNAVSGRRIPGVGYGVPVSPLRVWQPYISATPG